MQEGKEQGWGGETFSGWASFPSHPKPSGNCSALQKVISLSLAGTQAGAGLPINPVISLMSVNS